MRKIIYTESQIKELNANKYVKNCSEKYITFTLACKIEVIKQLEKWIYFRDIFKKLWFPEYVYNKEIAKNTVKRWRKNKLEWKIESQKWRIKKEKIDFNNMTIEQENEYLKAKLALYEELADYMKTWFP